MSGATKWFRSIVSDRVRRLAAYVVRATMQERCRCGGRVYQRVAPAAVVPDSYLPCLAWEGSFHVRGCDRELCPFCGYPSTSAYLCFCRLKHFYPGYKRDFAFDERGVAFHGEDGRLRPKKTFFGLPEDVYKNGLSSAQEAEWIRAFDARGRIPHVTYPKLCARCGELWPEMFNVPDEEWEKYVKVSGCDRLLCRPCYDWIKMTICCGEVTA